MSTLPAPLQARKHTVQARSKVTVDAIRQAALQVLLAEGLARTTTTRVAQRAGVSVGSLYQYYPNRSALLASLLEWHLTLVADAVETACSHHHGTDLDTMADALVNAFVSAKLEHADISLALYAISDMHGGAALVAAGRARMLTAITAMLATACDGRFSQTQPVALTLLGAMGGAMRDLMDAGAPAPRVATTRAHLGMLVRSFLHACKNPG